MNLKGSFITHNHANNHHPPRQESPSQPAKEKWSKILIGYRVKAIANCEIITSCHQLEARELQANVEPGTKIIIMIYKIIEVHCIYEKNELQEVAVLWQSNNDGSVRASYSDTTPCSGYKYLTPEETLSPELIQKVAGQGMNLYDEKKNKYFPGIRKWEK